MKPFLITTPRSGSTLIQAMLFNIAKQTSNFKADLIEPWTITELFKPTYTVSNGTVQLERMERVGHKWFNNRRAEKLKVIDLIKDDPSYMMKLFPVDIEPEIEMIMNDYDVICLERNDKVHQMLSWVLLWETNKSHYKVDDTGVIKSFTYNRFHATEFIRHLEHYKKFKDTHKNYKILYYEDFINEGANEAALCKLLNIEYNITPMQIKTKPTPYANKIENLIINKKDWLEDKPFLLKEIQKYS